MKKLRPAVLAVMLVVGTLCLRGQADSAQEPVLPHPGMLRYPDVSATHIVFRYADALWLVPRAGGTAVPVASPPAPAAFPRFSPDGKTIAFEANYDGNQDLYTIPVEGGVPVRLTHHSSGEHLTGWTPDGRLIFSLHGMGWLEGLDQLFTVSAKGGLPARLPVPYGTNGVISPDGRWLAYTPCSADLQSWKRYRGGAAPDIWLFDLADKKSRKVTDWEGTDTLPMWHGRDVYYLSDAGPAHRLNIWRYDTGSGRREQVTHFRDFDVRWPSIGPGPHGEGEIVFQLGAELRLLDLATGRSAAVKVTIPGARPALRPHAVDASGLIYSRIGYCVRFQWHISPTGKSGVVEARGDIWVLPAKGGSPRNLTRTSGVAERFPAWSPDGRWIAYFSDVTGEYELYLTQSDGKGETRQLTRDRRGSPYFPVPTWSPDSRHIVFGDRTGGLFLHSVEGGKTKLVDTQLASTWSAPSWSPDSRWLAYARGGDAFFSSRNGTLWLYNVETSEKHQVASDMYNCESPTFDRRGDYLYFVSNRAFEPRYDDWCATWIYTESQVLMAIPLRKDMKSPYLPEIDEETWGEANDEKGADSDEGIAERARPAHQSEAEEPAGKEQDEAEPAEQKVTIDLEDIERRAIILPIRNGRFYYLAVNDKGALIYSRWDGEGSGIKLLDINDEKKEEKTVVAGDASFVISADGKKLLVIQGSSATIQDAAAGSSGKKLVTDGMTALVNPREEWRQIFLDAWRQQRDIFYDPNMHGVDWPAVRDQYLPMLDDCVSREDVGFVIGEMVSELNVSHTGYFAAGVETQPSVSVGMLGVDFELANGAYRIARIYEGAPWDADARNPLSQPGVEVREGDYVLAVNGVPVDVTQDPWAAFQGMADQVITLTVSSKPSLDEEAREVVVKAMGSDAQLRYRAWVEHNRAHVSEQTGGRVGYIYVPDTGWRGQNELVRQFLGQLNKEALIIDARWNQGGQVPDRFIELLNRPVLNYWALRDGDDWRWPPLSHQGPKCMLINGWNFSGGDLFPAYFRQAGLGKLMGTRTGGGGVTAKGPGLIDGGSMPIPARAYYTPDGTWGIEGHGVEPDIEVVDDPALMVDGGDPQLDAAIEHMLAELERNPYRPPERPPYPDRSGMEISETDDSPDEGL